MGRAVPGVHAEYLIELLKQSICESDDALILGKGHGRVLLGRGSVMQRGISAVKSGNLRLRSALCFSIEENCDD
jgi:hypothetical protein